MAELVAQNQQGTFSDPQNGNSPIDADEVTANDNALRTKHNTHDADGTIHVQSSALASRPSAGTMGRKWWTVDAGVVRQFYDTGSTWEEVAYVPTGSAADIDGVLTYNVSPEFPEDVAFDQDVSVGGNLDVDGAAVVGTGLTVEAGGAAITGASTVTGTLGVSGTATAASFSGSASGLTSIPAAQLTGTIDNARLPTAISVTTLTASSTATAAGYRSASGASYGFRTTSTGSGGTIDASTTNHHRHTMTGNGAITISNMSDAQRLIVEVLQDSVGGRTVTWSGVTAWPASTTPTVSSALNKKDVFVFVKCGADVLGFVGAQNFASTS